MSSLSQFEKVLPNELLLMVFEYLNVHDLFQSFYNMNQRFNDLIHSMSLYHIDLNNIQRKATLDYYRHSIIPKIQHQQNKIGIVLDIDDDLCNSIRILDQLNLMNLKSLRINKLNEDNAIYLLSILPTLTQLSFLRIQSKVNLNLDQFLQLITIPSLKQFELLFLNYYYPSYTSIESQITVSNIEYLCVYRYFRIQQFQELLRYLPKLKKLFMYIMSGGYSSSSNINLHELVPNLSDLQLYVQTSGFDELQSLLRPLSQQLKRLAISCWSYEYADGQKWKIFLKSFSLLKHFHLDITLSTLPSHPINLKQILSTFQTKFFLDAHWHFAIDYNPNVHIKFVLYTLPWPIKYFHTILYNIETLSTTTAITDHSYWTQKVQNLYIELYDQVSNSTAVVNKNHEQRYYSNVESLILINHLSNNPDRSSQIIDDLCHTIDLTKIKSLKFDHFDHLQSTSLINLMDFIPNLLELKINLKIYLQHQFLISRISTIQTLILYFDSDHIAEDILTNCFSLLSPDIKNLKCITNNQNEIWNLLKTLYRVKFLNIEKLLFQINNETVIRTFTNGFIHSIDQFMTKMSLDDKYDFIYKINEKKQLVIWLLKN